MELLKDIRSCTYCKDELPLGPNPIVSFSEKSRIVVIGQAPGLKVHESGVPWSDASGRRLREWLDVDEATFYDTNFFGIVPMGFCYPGKGGSGDLPPRKECAWLFMDKILETLTHRKIVLLIGQYAQNYFLEDQERNLTETVKNYKKFLPQYMVLPHPSPRNNIWLKKNPWFEKDNLRVLRKIIKELI